AGRTRAGEESLSIRRASDARPGRRCAYSRVRRGDRSGAPLRRKERAPHRGRAALPSRISEFDRRIAAARQGRRVARAALGGGAVARRNVHLHGSRERRVAHTRVPFADRDAAAQAGRDGAPSRDGAPRAGRSALRTLVRPARGTGARSLRPQRRGSVAGVSGADRSERAAGGTAGSGSGARTELARVPSADRDGGPDGSGAARIVPGTYARGEPVSLESV